MGIAFFFDSLLNFCGTIAGIPAFLTGDSISLVFSVSSESAKFVALYRAPIVSGAT